MKALQIFRKLALATCLVVGAMIPAAVMSPSAARADATCSSLIPGMFSNLTQHGGWYNIEVTVTKDPLADVTYSSGSLSLSGSYLYGTANLLFSDRFSGNQPFNVNASESIQVWVDQTGHVWIWNNNYNYYIVSNNDMSCTGGLISKYVSGLGLVTIAVRNWNPPIG